MSHQGLMKVPPIQGSANLLECYSWNRKIHFQSCYALDWVPDEDSSLMFGSGSEVGLFDPYCFSPLDLNALHYERVALQEPNYLFHSFEV